MNLKVPGAILPIGCAILSTRAKSLRGVVATLLGELGLIKTPVFCNEYALRKASDRLLLS